MIFYHIGDKVIKHTTMRPQYGEIIEVPDIEEIKSGVKYSDLIYKVLLRDNTVVEASHPQLIRTYRSFTDAKIVEAYRYARSHHFEMMISKDDAGRHYRNGFSKKEVDGLKPPRDWIAYGFWTAGADTSKEMASRFYSPETRLYEARLKSGYHDIAGRPGNNYIPGDFEMELIRSVNTPDEFIMLWMTHMLEGRDDYSMDDVDLSRVEATRIYNIMIVMYMDGMKSIVNKSLPDWAKFQEAAQRGE